MAVVAICRQLGVPEHLVLLLEGESLFNDATAIVVFSVFIAIATQDAGPMSLTEGGLFFLRVFSGGLLCGAIIGAGFLLVTRLATTAVTRAAASLICAYLAFAIAESVLHVSGVMAVLVAGMLLGHAARGRNDSRDEFTGRLWDFNAWIANALVFLLMGITITTDMFTERWLAMLIGIAAVILARAVGIFGILPLLPAGGTAGSISYADRSILYWGGLRGAVTLALALSLPTSLDYWWTIQSIAFGVVLFTLFLQATTMASAIRRSGMQ